MARLTWVLVGFVVASGAATARSSGPVWKKTMSELVLSLTSSAVNPPDPMSLTMSGLRAVKDRQDCLEWSTRGSTMSLRCGRRSVEIDVYPPRRGRDVADVLIQALSVTHKGDRVPAATVESVARALAISLDDPYTNYVPPAEVARLSTNMKARVANPGISLQPYEPSEVKSVRHGSDAERRGVQPGDHILSIDGIPTESLTYQESTLRLIGPAGTPVRLKVQTGEDTPRMVIAVRTLLPESRIAAERLPGNVLYLRVARFEQGCAREAELAVREYPGTRGTILDLRHNGGGRIEEGIALLDLFLSDGAIGGVKGRPGRPQEEYKARYQGSDVKTPLVVLVDSGTASAAELVSLVLKDRGRAIVLGGQTTGKGTVQRQIPLPDKGVLFVTTARYLGADGEPLPKDGLSPHRFLPPPRGSTVLDGRAAMRDSWVLAALEELEGQPIEPAALQSAFGPRP